MNRTGGFGFVRVFTGFVALATPLPALTLLDDITCILKADVASRGPPMAREMARRTIQRHPDGALHVSVHEEEGARNNGKGEAWHLYWQQLPGGEIAIGGFRDQAGPSEWSLDATPTSAVQDRLEVFVRTHLGVQAPITHRWAACAGYTESGLPVLEQVRAGVWALGGYSGTGNVIGALSGRAVVAAALDGNLAPARVLHGPQWSTTVTG